MNNMPYSLKTFSLIKLLTIGLLLSANLWAYEKIDNAIAIVEDDILFSTDLEKRIIQTKARLAARGQSLSEQRLQEQALESLILEKLQLILAKKNNIIATQAEIDALAANTKKNLRNNGITYQDYLSSQQLTNEEANKSLEKEIIINKIQQSIINQRIQVTEREIDNFLNSTEGQEWLTPRFHLGHILLPYNEKNKTQIMKQAASLYTLLQNPKTDFSAVAAKYSKGPNANKGGDLGVRKKEELPELFVTQIAELQPEETTQPFQSPAGVHILKLFSRTGAEPVIVDQYKVRHILIKPTELFTNNEAKAKIDALYARLLKGEDFNVIAAEYTDDIGSKLSGGDLGWSMPGGFVPEFERIMLTTPINQISKPFSSQFGWHILTVEDQRKKDVFEDVKRKQVANLLGQQRFQDELQIWLKELRDNSYVELLI
jgi:peptidyl-prolyl cis-trans isomerase SurA